MKVIIIEDEKPAAEKLRKGLLKHDPAIEIPAVLGSVASALDWFALHPQPSLAFMDIELSDGLSFRLFEEGRISCPVIFTTAFDEYWQEAFEHNGLDYLLKPIRPEKLEQAMRKYQSLKQHFIGDYAALFEQWKTGVAQNGFRKRLLLKKGIDWIALKTEDLAYAFAAHKLTFLVDRKGQQFILDKSLADLEKELDPGLFFRVSRKYLVNLHHIKRIRSQARSKLSLELDPPVKEELVVGPESAAAFKQWINR
jgi:DNA-binding LytR/AlgR family response regulator